MSSVVELRPDLAAFKRETMRGVEQVSRQAGDRMEKELGESGRKAGRKAGDAAGDGLTKGTTEGARRAGRKIDDEIVPAARKTGDRAGKELGDGISKHAGGGISGLAGKLDSVGKKMLLTGGVMTAGLTLPAVAIGKAAADSAIQFEDAIAANEQLFGKEGLARIEAWSKAHADAFNIAKGDVQTVAQGFAGYMQAYGDERKAAEETTKVLERLADTRSFYGGRMEDKAMALQAALRGEYDPMETAFPGASIKASDVAARAAQMGLLTVNTAELGKAQAVVAEREQKVQGRRLDDEGGEGPGHACPLLRADGEGRR
jgi:hypothetical protein